MMKKRVTVAVFLMLLLFSIASVANAAVRASDYFYEWSAKVDSNSTGTVNISFAVRSLSNMDKIGAKTIILQEKAAGSSTWNAVKTYNYTNYSGMLKSGALRHDYTVSYYNAVSGNNYRAKVYFYAEKGGSDTIEYITDIVKAK